MKFVVEKTKPGFYEDEYRISLPDKTKDKLRTLAGLTVAVGGVGAAVLYNLPSRDKNNTKTAPPEENK